MGQITSGIGLVSGINSAQIIDQLLALEARPKQMIESRNAILTSQQVAYQDINAKLLVLKLSSGGFLTNQVFKTTAANSSNPTAITASSSTAATPGSYNFTVSRLVTTQQVISRGFIDRDASPVGAGTLTFEFGDAKLTTDTPLSRLNGGEGVARGKVRITDRSGASAVVDLSKALTVNDVLEAINDASGINVRASVDGDGLRLTDNTGAAVADLAVASVGAADTAASLGLNAPAAGSVIAGNQINRIGAATLLGTLNDGNGVRRAGGLADFQVTRRDGTTFEVSLGGATTLGEAIDAIDAASGGTVAAAVNAAGTGIQLTDSTGGGGTLAVAALNGSKAAEDLGVLGSDGNGDGVIDGGRLVAKLNSRLVRNLKGGTGTTLGTVGITNRSGNAFAVDLSGATSVSDVVDLINAAGARVTAAVNATGTGVTLTDTTDAAASNLIVSDITGTAAADLGLAGSVAGTRIDSGNLQLRYLSEATTLASLNGGLGVGKGQFKITDSLGATATIDLSQGNETTVADVLAEINSRGLALNARVNDNGDGILIEDTGPGTVKLKVEEAGSTTARDLGILGEAAEPGDDIDGTAEKTVTLDGTETLTQLAQKVNDARLPAKATIISDGSPTNPYRLSLLSTRPGRAGAFVFDDGGLGLGASELVEARDAVVFFGSADPARALPITSSTNTLSSVIPGATINLLSTTTGPVEVNIAIDDGKIVEAAKKFADDFNTLIDTLNKYDAYNAETKQRGLLLGDATVERVRSSLYRLVNNRNTDLSTQFNSLAQVGISVGTGAKVKFDEAKFRRAMEQDRAAVEQLFTFKETRSDGEGNTTVTAAGIGVKIDELLKSLTDAEGAVPSQVDVINDQIALNKKRITAIDAKLEAKRLILQNQFNQMEKALAQLQKQGTALAGFQPLLAQAGGQQ